MVSATASEMALYFQVSDGRVDALIYLTPYIAWVTTSLHRGYTTQAL
jgi:hypothetical protein